MANEKRLIDANALLARLASSSESWAKNLQAIRNWWPHAVGIKDNIVSLIKEAPTVDAVEVVHGRWEERYAPNGKYVAWYGFYCSVCGKQAAKSNYCPKCGAKMDGDGDG